MNIYKKRKIQNLIALSFSFLTAFIGIFFLSFILFDLISKGISHININLFTLDTAPAVLNIEGGLRQAFIGQLILTLIATLIGVPLGILSGTFLAEYGRYSKFGRFISNLADITVSMPTIIIGTFIYAILVKPFGSFNGWAGAIALAIIMLPVVMRTTEEMMNLVPDSLREAAFALGASKTKVTIQIVWKSAISGIFTGVILSIARIAGETAPLLFTSFNNNFLSFDMSGPMPSLTVTIYQYAASAYDNWVQLAWAGSLVITLFILVISVFGRYIVNWRANKSNG